MGVARRMSRKHKRDVTTKMQNPYENQKNNIPEGQKSLKTSHGSKYAKIQKNRENNKNKSNIPEVLAVDPISRLLEYVLCFLEFFVYFCKTSGILFSIVVFDFCIFVFKDFWKFVFFL